MLRRNDAFTFAQADSKVLKIKNDGYDFVKLLSLSDENTFYNIAHLANKHQIPFCGHYPVYRKNRNGIMIQMDSVLNNNFKSIEHLGGYIYLRDKETIDATIQLT